MRLMLDFCYRIASGSWDNTIKIANLNTGKCLQTLTGHTGVIYALEVLESDQLASGSYDGSIKVWDTSKGRLFKHAMHL